MAMTKEEVIESLCATAALAYRSIGDYSYPSDGFCARCNEMHGRSWIFQNTGYIAKYVRLAVLEKLVRDRYSIDSNFDPITGEEKIDSVALLKNLWS